MEIIKSNNGFPYAWKAGRVEKLICSILEDKARQQLDVDRVMIINPTWLHENDIIQQIKDARPDFIICHNFVDPAVPKMFEAIQQSGIPHVIIGNSAQCRLDFWAIVTDLFFQNYEEYDVAIQPSARKYICLNRKPHPHRITLVEELINAGLQQQGYLSLGLTGDRAITIEEAFNDEQGINDEFGNLGVDETFVSSKIRNDIFSLGDTNIWMNSYFCLVTETEFTNAYPDNFFISEKTFKPIIGMRPFFIYGQAPLRQYLKDAGFDIFEDIFDYSKVDEAHGDKEKQVAYAKVAIDAINRIVYPAQDYSKLFGRCQRNKTQFRNYIYKQWNILNNLDLTKFL